MRKVLLILPAAALAGLLVRAADWPTANGNPQREGWAKAEKSFTKENAKGIELLYRYKASDNQARGPQSLTTPLINGNLITYLGFKEMLVFGGSSDRAYSVDADLNRIIWKTHFEYKGDKPQASATNTCPGGVTAPVAMPGSSTAGGRGGFGGGRGPGRAGAQPQPVNARPPQPPGPRQSLFTAGFGRAGVFVLVTGDGYLHALNTSTGADKIPPIQFLPANAKTNSLNIDNGTIYAATVDGCGGSANALYAINMLADDVSVASFPTNGSGFSGALGTAIAADGTVFGHVTDGRGEVAGTYNDTVLALTPQTLKVRDYFSPVAKARAGAAVATPLVIQYKGKDVVIAAGSDGSVYVLDAAHPGGADHHTPLFASAPAAAAATGFASYEDAEGARWVYASTPNSVVGYKLEEREGKPALTSAWTSGSMIAPAAPALANGVVFALSSGDRQKHAVLYALDGATGKELYNSGNAAATYSHGSGIAIANSRIYVTTHDNTVLCFGFFAEQPQLTGK